MPSRFARCCATWMPFSRIIFDTCEKLTRLCSLATYNHYTALEERAFRGMRVTLLSLGTAAEDRLRTCLLRPMALPRRRSTYAIEYCRSYGTACRQSEHVHWSRRTTLGEPRPWKQTQH